MGNAAMRDPGRFHLIDSLPTVLLNLKHLFPGSARDQRIMQVNPRGTSWHYGIESDLLLTACGTRLVHCSRCCRRRLSRHGCWWW
jgi:hypothetical protein